MPWHNESDVQMLWLPSFEVGALFMTNNSEKSKGFFGERWKKNPNKQTKKEKKKGSFS